MGVESWGLGAVNLDTPLVQHLRWSFYQNDQRLFSQKALLCLKYAWKGSEYASATLENTNNLSSKKESGSTKNCYENICHENSF